MLKNSWTDSLGRFRPDPEGCELEVVDVAGAWELVALGLDSLWELWEGRPCGSFEGVLPMVDASASARGPATGKIRLSCAE